MCLFVVTAGIDLEFNGGDAGEVDGVVLDFGSRSGWAERPLLANDLAVVSIADGGEAEFLGSLVLRLAKFETDAADGAGLVEF